MRSIPLELPDDIAADVDRLVREGRFRRADDLARWAVVDHVRRQQREVIERQQLEDINWAMCKSAEPTR